MSDQPVLAQTTSTEPRDVDNQSELFAALYNELRAMARRELRRRGADLTLGATTLLHESYLDIAARQGLRFPNRMHFLAYACRVMRGRILNYRRDRARLKRGGGAEITALSAELPEESSVQDLQRLSDAIDQLARVVPRCAHIVDLKYFCGLSFTDIAAMLGVSERTVQRDWEKARLLLYRELTGASDAGAA